MKPFSAARLHVAETDPVAVGVKENTSSQLLPAAMEVPQLVAEVNPFAAVKLSENGYAVLLLLVMEMP